MKTILVEIKKISMRLDKIISWCLLVFAFILIGVGARYWQGWSAVEVGEDKLISQALSFQAEQILELQLVSSALLAENAAVANRLEDEKKKRLVAEASAKAGADRLNQLEKEVANNQTVDLANIVSSWRPRVAALKCQWNFSSGANATSAGSAVYLPGVSVRGGPALLTNKHVVDFQGLVPNTCTVQFPNQAGAYFLSSTDILPSPERDFAILEIQSPGMELLALSNPNFNRCINDAKIGDEIVILGYPSIGSRSDITATEGIISGYENGYYLSSAKVERGNSGGAAVLVKDNCYLGIPSFVDVGQIESLARILDQKLIQ